MLFLLPWLAASPSEPFVVLYLGKCDGEGVLLKNRHNVRKRRQRPHFLSVWISAAVRRSRRRLESLAPRPLGCCHRQQQQQHNNILPAAAAAALLSLEQQLATAWISVVVVVQFRIFCRPLCRRRRHRRRRHRRPRQRRSDVKGLQQQQQLLLLLVGFFLDSGCGGAVHNCCCSLRRRRTTMGDRGW
jgi:hypothetical protein